MKIDHVRLFIFILATTVVVHAQSADAKKLAPADAKRLVAEAFGADAKKAGLARGTLEATRPEDRKAVAVALATLPFVAPKSRQPIKDRALEAVIDAPMSATKKGKFIIALPKAYDDKKPSPLLFRFHGSGDTAAAYAKVAGEPNHPFICVTPEIPSGGRMGWNEPGVQAFVDELFRYLRLNFNVDPERIYLSGHSAGGGAAFAFSQIWPHRVAAFYSMARLHWSYETMPGPCMDTLREVPGYFVVGMKDTEERVSGFRTAEAYYKKNGLPGVFTFVEGRGHEYLHEQHPKAYDYLIKSSRKPNVKDARGVLFAYANSADAEPVTRRRWWIEAQDRGYDPGGTVFHAQISGNTIEIDAPKLKSFFIYLNDALVDMDQPVTVKLNGGEVHNAVVERSVAFLLGDFAAERDRGLLYWNRILVSSK